MASNAAGEPDTALINLFLKITNDKTHTVTVTRTERSVIGPADHVAEGQGRRTSASVASRSAISLSRSALVYGWERRSLRAEGHENLPPAQDGPEGERNDLAEVVRSAAQ